MHKSVLTESRRDSSLNEAEKGTLYHEVVAGKGGILAQWNSRWIDTFKEPY